jgi:hypothetical protein
MHTVDPAVYTNLLGARAGEAAARLERARVGTRYAGIEEPARNAPSPRAVQRLDHLGCLVPVELAAVRRAARELVHTRALEEPEAWVEHGPFAAREEGYAVRG